MEENEGKDLAVDMKKEQEQTEKYYENVRLKLSKISLDNVTIGEKNSQKQMEDGRQKDIVTYDVYIPFKGKNVHIATIDETGKLVPNEAILEDEKYSDEDKKKLGDMLNLLGLEQEKVNVDKLQEQLQELEAKTKEELEQEIEEKNRDDETIKDKENNEEKEEDDAEDLGESEKKGEEKVIAKRKHIDSKNVCKIRRDSQFYKNYPNVPKTAFFYLDENDRMHAEYIDKDGTIKELPGFNEIKDRSKVTSFGNDGQNIKEEMPYRVMTASGLEDKNTNTQDIRIAMYKDNYGYLKIETIHQGRNGEWEGKNIDTYGRDRNTAQMNRIIDEKNKTPQTGRIAERHEELKKTGYSVDGIQLDELSKKRKIDEYMNDGYTFEEANNIYEYVVGDLELTEEDAKVKVNEEREEKARPSGGRDQGEEAFERLMNRGH